MSKVYPIDRENPRGVLPDIVIAEDDIERILHPQTSRATHWLMNHFAGPIESVILAAEESGFVVRYR